MLALQIKDIKTFMNKLLNGDTFNLFLVKEVQIKTSSTFLIDGHLNKEFFAEDMKKGESVPANEMALWKDIQPVCFQLIKGKKTPLLFKLTLIHPHSDSSVLLKDAGMSAYLSSLKGFVLTIRYDTNGLLLTTGTSFQDFLFDKTPDQLWDDALCRFLTYNEIDFI